VSVRAPIRYHGGKWLLADWIVRHFPRHQSYVEPYGGGASVLLHKAPAEVETYNDLDHDVVNFFRVLRDDPTRLVRAIELTPFARAEFTVSWLPVDDPIERARRFYVRSWQARGMGEGVVETGWRIARRPSRWQAPCREWTEIDHLYGVAERLHGVQIECDQALAVMQRYDGPDTLIYLDPPYLPETLTGPRTARTYSVGMDSDDHAELAAAACQLEGYVIVSGYPSELYGDLYEARGWQRVEHAGQVNFPDTQRAEALWLSPRTTGALGVQPHLFD